MRKILIVDDQPEIRELLLEIISYIKNTKTKAVSDPQQALSAMKEESFDLVITDLNMPYMNGIELSREMRKAGEKMPIFLFTGDQTIRAKEETEQAGIDEIIYKPSEIKKLVLLIKKYCMV